MLPSSGQKINAPFYNEDGGNRFLRKHWYLSTEWEGATT